MTAKFGDQALIHWGSHDYESTAFCFKFQVYSQSACSFFLDTYRYTTGGYDHE